MPASIVLALLCFIAQAHANPTGGTVSGGSATITNSGPVETIRQSTQNAVINWQSFNIGANQTTKFVQPDAAATTLNRVNAGNPSQILGALDANGNVILINPNGVFFGKGSQVDVNGLVATSSNIANQNFMQGKLNFNQPGNPDAQVVNQGTITAGQAGLVGLVAPTVVNSGTINAKLGHVDLSSGDTFTLDIYGDGLINVGVSDAVRQQLIQNSGTINAAGGTIALTAGAGRQVINSLVSVPGKLNAPAAAMQNGEIDITNASAGGQVQVSGTLNAAGPARGQTAGQTGGKINITGSQVGINSGAVVDASGTAGGGAINIGGDLHGHGPLQNAQSTLVAASATVKANALNNGNGGQVVVWSNQQTTVNGSVQAKGGPQGGNGGLIETSSHGVLNVTTPADAAAPQGKSGTWLLDPASVTITNAANSNMNGCPACVPNGTVATSNLSTATIDAALNAGTNVSVTTGGDGAANAGDITVSNAISTTGSGSLTLSSYHDIIVNAAITLAGGALTLQADNAGAASGGYINIAGAISTGGGNITLGGGTGSITAGNGYAVGSAIVDGDVAQPAGVLVSGVAVNAGGGNIIINGQGLNTTTNGNYGVEVNGGIISTTGAGDVSISGLGSGNANSGNDYGVFVTGAALVSSVNGALTVNGTGGGAGTGATNYGVYVSGAGSTIETTGSGNVSMTGAGGDAGGSGGKNYGVFVSVADGVQTTGTGGISVTGTGGNSSGIEDYGVSVTGSMAAAGGAISVIGTGGLGTGNEQYGVDVSGATAEIMNTGTGTITLNGTAGGTSTSGDNYGVYVSGGGIASTVNGNLTINGTGSTASTGFNNYGFYITGAGSAVETTGSGNVSVNGTGGGAVAIAGVFITAGGSVETTGTGGVSVAGTGGGTGGYGIDIASVNGIQTTGGGNISVTGQGGAGSGVGNYGTYLAGGTVTTLGSGAITLSGTGGGIANSGFNYGVYVGAGGVVSTVNGNLTVNNTTGGGAGTGTSNYGVYVNGAGSTIETTGSGNVSVTGTGGNSGGSGTANNGVFINTSTGIQATGSGTITVSGTGSNSSGNTNQGVVVAGSIVSSGGAISVTGTGGSGGGTNNIGVLISTGTGVVSNTSGGAISVTGTGGGTGNSGTDYGVAINGTVSTTNGNININGTGGGAGTGGSNYGFYVTGAGSTVVTTGSGNISVTAMGGNGGGGTNTAAVIASANGIQTSGSGNVTMTANTLALSAADNIDSIGNLTIQPQTANTTVGVGTGAGTLSVNDADLTWGQILTIGSATAGNMDIIPTASFANPADFLAGAGNVILDGTVTSTSTAAGTTLLLDAGGNFFNNVGATAINPGSGRWLVYSTNPAANTLDGITANFDRYTCVYNGACPAFPGTGDGLLYTFTPVLTAAPTQITVTYGSATPSLTGYGYTVSGYLSGDAGQDTVTGSLNGTTPYIPTSTVAGGPYAINYSSGSLTSALGYGFTYANTPSGILVNPAALTITANNIAKTYGTTYSFAGTEFTDAGLVNGDTVSSVTLTSPGAAATATVAGGPYAIMPSGAAGSGLSNYTITYVNGQMTVNPAALTITANNIGKTYGTTYSFAGTEFTHAGLVNGDTVSGVTLASPGAAATATVAGSPYAITPSAAAGTGLSNYTITYVNGQMTVDPAALTITANSFGKTYGTTYSFAGTEFTDSGLVNGDSVSSAGLSSAGAAATATVAGGPYAITPSAAVGTGLGNYNITYVNGQLTVNPAALTVTANSFGKTYGTAYSFAGTEFTNMGLVNGDTISSVTLTSPGAAATATVAGGPYAITTSAAVGSGLSNYTITYVNGQMTVNPAALTITANNASMVYGSASLPSFGVTYIGFVNGETAANLTTTPTVTTTATAYNGTAGSGSNVDAYPTVASGAVDSNYTISYVNGTLQVTPYTLDVTANALSKLYATNDPALTYAPIGGTSLQNGDTNSVFTGALSRNQFGTLAGEQVGSYAINQNTLSAGGNYTIAYTAANLNITPATLSINANAQTKVYGTNDPALTYTDAGLVNATVDGVAISDSLSGALTRNQFGTLAGEQVGSYAITLGTLAATNPADYTTTYTGANLTITKGKLDVTANPETKVYGQADPALTYTDAGLVNGTVDGVVIADSLAGALTRAPGQNVGNYAINQGTLSGSGDYSLVYAGNTLTITPAPLTITANNQTIVYGNGFPAFTVTYTGLVNGDTAASLATRPTVASGTPANANVGVYAGTLTPSGAVDGNYTIGYVNGDLTVNPAALTITANNLSKTYGTTYTFAGTEFRAVGLTNGDMVSAVALTSAGAASAAPTGPYPITPSAAIGIGLGNYVIVYDNGTLSVVPVSTSPPVSTLPGPVIAAVTGTGTGTNPDDGGNDGLGIRSVRNTSSAISPVNPCIALAAQDTLPNQLSVDMMDIIKISPELAETLPFYKTQTQSFDAAHVSCQGSAPLTQD